MREMEKLLRGEKLREQMAYLRIAKGMTLKEAAALLGINAKTADYHWECAKRMIQGRPTRYQELFAKP